jgi:hypothetical protein
MPAYSVHPAPYVPHTDQMPQLQHVAPAPAPHRECRIFCLFQAVINLAVAYQAYVDAQLDEVFPIGRPT